MKQRLLFQISIFILILLIPNLANAYLYTIKPNANLRKGPGTNYKVIQQLDHNQTLTLINAKEKWLKVKTQSGKTGFIHQSLVSDTWIKVHKKERKLFLMKQDKPIKTYTIALSHANPLGDKDKLGDLATPEGRFYLCQNLKNPPARYGSRSMRISYPNIEDARRGLASGLIDYKTYIGIVRAIKAGNTPNQKTPLGGSIRVHGNRTEHYYTLGCMALSNEDMADLYDRVQQGARIEIYKSAHQEKEINAPKHLSKNIVTGANEQLMDKAFYSEDATAIIKMKYPGGDIPKDKAACTDIVIRALRKAGIDLQVLLHEDILIHPERYKRWVIEANYHIDHRRTRNLQVLFEHYTLKLSNDPKPYKLHDYLPGDVVVFDTGIPNGTPYDHIGVAIDKDDSQGLPMIVNIWNTGWQTMALPMLGYKKIKIKGHFRFVHPFDYQ